MTKNKYYEKEAIEALAKCGGTMTIKLSNTKDAPWKNDGQLNGLQSHYKVTLKSNLGSYTFDFYSIVNFNNGENPTVYDVLSCLDFYIPEKFEDFCDDFGYDSDSIKVIKTWKACLKQSQKLHKLFPHDSQKELLSSIR